jgi:UDP-N-acetylmuramoyl-L-alanyl-D-glutamate--2,6-diaminopimelate ligase
MKNISELFRNTDGKMLSEIHDLSIAHLTTNSADIRENTLFIAQKGSVRDGHDFIEAAIEKGAKAIVAERMPEKVNKDVLYYIVKDSREAAGLIAAAFYDFPSRKLRLVGVTGTNGKTTNVTLLFKLFRALGHKAGLISTVKNQINDRIIPATHTTPDVISLNALLREMCDEGCEYAFMEVSSHGVDQKRIFGLEFSGAIFTNITHDHLDYHKTFDNYINAKKGFFDMLGKNAFALVNADDKRADVMLQNCAAKHYKFALKSFADFHAKMTANSFAGLCLQIGKHEVWFRMTGEFNAYNLLGVYAAAVLLGKDEEEVLRVLSGLSGAEGRLETYTLPNGVFAVIDYAHTPDALENVLKTLRDIRTGNQKIITLIGCGGNRDKEKRPKMAQTAFLMSDLCFLTSDNPRNEKPEDILADMCEGLKEFGDKSTLYVISDRREAVRKAYKLAQKNDIILIAGKGHENYQEIQGVKHHFSDKEEIFAAAGCVMSAE